MPKRSVKAYDPKGIRLNHTWYSDRDIEAIIDVAGGLPDGDVEHEVPLDEPGNFHHTTVRVPRRQALKDRLESAARVYAAFSDFQTKPTAKQMADILADIETAAAKLIAALHLPETMDETNPLEHMLPALRYGLFLESAGHEERRVGGFPDRDSVQRVYQLRDWAKAEKDKCRAEPVTPPTQRHMGDETMDDLFRDFTKIWVEIFERKIGTSVGGPLSLDASQASGPFIRFLHACLQPILKKAQSEGAIRERVRRLFQGKVTHKSTPK